MEGDLLFFPHIRRHRTFQSTPSVWRETSERSDEKRKRDISIHSLRMEGDDYTKEQYEAFFHFNPLPPYGGRLGMIVNFQSGIFISIHSLRMEGDDQIHAFTRFTTYFNPLPPYGGRPARYPGRIYTDYFNPLPPYGGRPRV